MQRKIMKYIGFCHDENLYFACPRMCSEKHSVVFLDVGVFSCFQISACVCLTGTGLIKILTCVCAGGSVQQPKLEA